MEMCMRWVGGRGSALLMFGLLDSCSSGPDAKAFTVIIVLYMFLNESLNSHRISNLSPSSFEIGMCKFSAVG